MGDSDTIEKSVKDLEKEITCAICHLHYIDPKVLPCCHYYCKQCIHSLALRTGVDRPFSCPECRKTTTLPQGGVKDLPTAFFINRMKATLSNMERAHGKVEAKCEMCSRDKAKAFCVQCAMFICAECVKQHKILRVFSGHRTSTLEELKEGGAGGNVQPESTLPSCKLHDEKMKLYCFDCSCLICRDCTIKDHRDHGYEFITVAAPRMKEELIQQLDPLKEASTSLSLAAKEIQGIKSEVEAQGHSVANSIQTSFEELRQIIEVRKQELLAESAMKVAEKLERLSVQEKGLSASCAVIQSVIDYTEQCVQHSADDEVMNMHREIQSRIDREIKEQQAEGKNAEPVEEADVGMVVSCAEDLKQLCQTKAKVTQLNIEYGVNIISAELNKVSELQLTVNLSNGKPVKRPQLIKGSLKSVTSGSVTECKVDAITCGEYRIQYTPTVRGRHELAVSANGLEVSESPFPVFVSIQPAQLCKPVKAISTDSPPVDVAVNSSGATVLATSSAILLLDKKGRTMKRFMCRNLQETFVGVAVDTTNDNVYAATRSRSLDLLRLSPELKLLQECMVQKQQKHPISGVTVVRDEVMVCDQENRCVKVYSKTLEYVRRFGKGKGTDQLYGLSSNADGSIVYVCDCGNNSVLVFSNAGDFMWSFQLDSPWGVCVGGEHVYVSGGRQGVVVLLRTTCRGQQVASFGLFRAWGVCVDRDGFVHVCDYYNRELRIF